MTGTVAFVGGAGGVGTTRTTLGCARLLAGEGLDTAVLDAAYGTQGLADRVRGRIDPDVTELCLTDRPLEAGLIDLDASGAGRLAVCPARAPYERLARAKTVEAAERFEALVAEAARGFDRVLVDTPPLATNPAVAAVSAVEAVAVVADADRAADAVPRTEDRLADVGHGDGTTTVVTGAETHPDADATVPTVAPELSSDERAEGFGDVVEAVFGVTVERPESDGLLDGVLT